MKRPYARLRMVECFVDYSGISLILGENRRTFETGMTEKNDIRCQIIEAAKKRFSHFGYAKTTMAEVAADCSMSPGNLYRFFPGKLDIAESIATDDYAKHLEHLRKIA